MLSENIKRARTHIVFLFALIAGSVLIYFLNAIDMEKKGYTKRASMELTAPNLEYSKEELSTEEIKWAKIAWKYFEYNYQDNTGLVNSSDKFPSTTLWDTGDYLYALISAQRLGIIDMNLFDYRLNKLLTSLENLKLYNNALPNKVYNTSSLEMTDYNNNVVTKGIGWSAIDIGRILSPLFFIKKNYSKYSEKIHNIVNKWKFQKLQKKGQLYSCMKKNNKNSCQQEGRLGYEQYSANVFSLFAVGLYSSMKYTSYLGFTTIYDIAIPYDIRDKENFGANNYVLMEPYILDGLEFGWDYYSKEFSYRLYKVQEERYKRTKILTAITEDHIDQKPYFIYNSIFVNKKEWSAIAETGEEFNALKTLSTKASFGLYVLYHTAYTKKLMDKIKTLQTDKGWYAGFYEKDWRINKAITCNTNAIILEALLYKVEGPLLKSKRKK